MSFNTIRENKILKFTAVNSEIFARTLFSETSYAKFRENKILAKQQNHSVVY